MVKKLLTLVFTFCFLSSLLYASPRKITSQEKESMKMLSFKMTLIGDAVVYKREGAPNNINIGKYTSVQSTIAPNFTRTVQIDGITATLTFTSVGITAYTLQSNGAPLEIWQDPVTPANLHIAFTYSPNPDPAPGFTGRLVKYYYSSNSGTNWTFVANVPTIRAGFVNITGTSDGNALIANHTALTSGGTTRTVAFSDAFPGLGSFTSLDPGLNGSNAYIWPSIVATNSIALTNKFVIIASVNNTTYDSTFLNTGTSLSSSTFLGWNAIQSAIANSYMLARSDDGTRIGLVNIANGYNDAPDYGDVLFRESTNNGTSFSAPTKIFDAQWGSGDSLCAFNSVSLCYVGNVPKVVWEHVKQTRSGSFYPGYPSQLRYWSSDLPGTDPNRSKIIADTNNLGYHPYYHSGPNATVDGYTNTTRPVIGKSNTGNVLFVAVMVPSDYVGNSPDTVSFMDIYYLVSGNGGASWKAPVKMNPTTPVRDWIFPSVSQTNTKVGSNYIFNVACESDSLPGNYSTYTTNPQTSATYYYVKVSIPEPVGVGNITTQIPEKYYLGQNFPNPFNPVTTIRFALKKSSNVTLRVFNTNGQVVSTLIGNEFVSAGINEIKFDASNLASGIYFYSITAGDFTDTKKMILIK
jgi:hypothetical protein